MWTLAILVASVASALAGGSPKSVPSVLPTVPLAPGAAGIPTLCWYQPRYFRNFTVGTVDYCRGHLRYEPGELDCWYFTDEVCWVFLPGSNEWTDLTTPGAGIPFPCPYAPEPPVCPRLR